MATVQLDEAHYKTVLLIIAIQLKRKEKKGIKEH